MKRFIERLRRALVALTVLVVWSAPPGGGLRLVEGAPRPAMNKPMAIMEPHIPEYDLLLTRRRQNAIERASRLRQWEAEHQAHEASAGHRRLLHRELAVRREQLEQVADLVPRGYRLMVLDVSSQYGVEPRLLAAMGTVESQWYARALGRNGDSGLLQILPGTATWIADRMGLDQYDLYDPLTNLSMGAWYLQALHREHGSWDRALAAYNGGPRAVRLGSQHPYVGRIMQAYRRGGPHSGR